MKEIKKRADTPIREIQVKGMLKLFKLFSMKGEFNLEKHRKSTFIGMKFACGKPTKDVDIMISEWQKYKTVLYTPKQVVDEKFIIIYLHGGGYIFNNTDSYTGYVSRLAHETKIKCYSFSYPLAPENPYPMAVEAVFGFYRNLIEKGVDPSKIIFAGDSAGGGLCLSVVNKIQKSKVQMPCMLLLFSPWTDLTNSGESIKNNIKKDAILTPELLDIASKMYRGENNPKNPGISPLFDSYKNYPPVFLLAGSEEILLSDSDRLYDVLIKYNVDVHYTVWEDMPHAFIVGHRWFKATNDVFAEIKNFIYKRINL